MNKYIKLLGVAALAAGSLSSCLEETIPTDIVTEAALSQSAKAAEALLQGASAQYRTYNILGATDHYDIGFPGQLHINDIMTGDFPILESDYDHFTAWELVQGQGEDYAYPQLTWNTYYKLVLAANLAVKAFPADATEDIDLGYRSLALAFRASIYLDMGRIYEFLPNEKFSGIENGKDIVGLTCVWVSDETTQQEATDNPRVSHAVLAQHILDDLNFAEENISKAPAMDKQFPSLAVIYGLKARLCMWNEDYPNAAEYARKAINAFSGRPLNESEWLNTTTGFNTLETSAWMWGIQYNRDDAAVKTGILNWASFSCNEALWGYNGTSGGPKTMIDANLYDQISNNDFRKLSFKAPSSSRLSGQEPTLLSGTEWDDLPTYTGLKFRPGSGDITEPLAGATVAIPLMRVEEMYLIEAEAKAHSDAAAGAALLQDFIKTYRNPTYSFSSSDPETVIDECFLQKRIELWGEGQIIFDYKRLNKSVTRSYSGTNWRANSRFNTIGRPAWMTVVITNQEVENNIGVVGMNNPSPSGQYTSIDN